MAATILADPAHQPIPMAYENEDAVDSADEFHSAHSQWQDTASVTANPLLLTPTPTPVAGAKVAPAAVIAATHPVAKPLLPTYYRYFQRRLFQLSAHVHRTQHLVSLVETKLTPTALSHALSHRLSQSSSAHGLFHRLVTITRHSYHHWWPGGSASIIPQSRATAPSPTWPVSGVGIGSQRSTVLFRVLHAIHQLVQRLVVIRLRPLWYRLWVSPVWWWRYIRMSTTMYWLAVLVFWQCHASVALEWWSASPMRLLGSGR